MDNTISNICSVDIYGQLHLESSTAACSSLQKFDLGGGKNVTSRNSLKSLLFHLQQARRKHFGSGAAIGTKKTAGGLGGLERPPAGPGQSPGGGPGGKAPGSSVNLGILKP